MMNLLTKLFNRILYGRVVTEDYTGKVVKVWWSERRSYGGGEGHYVQHGFTLITVLWDDGSRFIAGSPHRPQEHEWFPYNFTSPADGLHHACKGRVTVVAGSLADYKEAERIRLVREEWRTSVCSNEAGVVGIVTDYDGVTFHGKSLDGSAWEAEDMKPLAENYQKYSQGVAEKT